MRRNTCVSVLAIALTATAVTAGPASQEIRQSQVVNRVIDLLDQDVPLGVASSLEIWESRPFDTSRYTQIVLAVSGEEGTAPILCRVQWRFSREQEFMGGAIPIAMVGTQSPDPRTSVGVFGFPIASGEIQGLQAKVSCELNPALGNDPGPSPVASILSDVQVLLRRH